jgi:hypothetical protein
LTHLRPAFHRGVYIHHPNLRRVSACLRHSSSKSFFKSFKPVIENAHTQLLFLIRQRMIRWQTTPETVTRTTPESGLYLVLPYLCRRSESTTCASAFRL